MRKKILEAKNYGYDSIEFQMPFLQVVKYFIIGIVALFSVVGFYEELTVKNTAFNKWVKAKLGHHDFH